MLLINVKKYPQGDWVVGFLNIVYYLLFTSIYVYTHIIPKAIYQTYIEKKLLIYKQVLRPI